MLLLFGSLELESKNLTSLAFYSRLNTIIDYSNRVIRIVVARDIVID